MSLALVVWDDTKNTLARGSGAFPDYRAGSAAVTIGTTSVAIGFSTPLTNTNFSVICTWRNLVDSSPQFQIITITAFTVNGFTASWVAPTDTGNYIVNWQCLNNA